MLCSNCNKKMKYEKLIESGRYGTPRNPGFACLSCHEKIVKRVNPYILYTASSVLVLLLFPLLQIVVNKYFGQYYISLELLLISSILLFILIRHTIRNILSIISINSLVKHQKTLIDKKRLFHGLRIEMKKGMLNTRPLISVNSLIILILMILIIHTIIRFINLNDIKQFVYEINKGIVSIMKMKK